MKRRELIALLGGVAFGRSLTVRAQQKVIPMIGFLSGRSSSEADSFLRAFLGGLQSMGYVEGQNVHIEYRWADGRYHVLSGLAADLVSRKVHLVAASGGNDAVLAAKKATSTIPVVFVSGGDPIALGLIDSLAHPGGNLTGVSFLGIELTPKRLELVSELVPGVNTIAVLVNPANLTTEGTVRDAQQAADRTGVRLFFGSARTEDEIEAVFATFAQQHPDALLVGADPFFLGQRDQFAQLASRHAMPAIYFDREFATAGGLMSYGTNLTDVYRQAGTYAGKVLNGAKPADLPVQQPTKLELVINLKTAKALGLTVPQALLARADEVIE